MTQPRRMLSRFVVMVAMAMLLVKGEDEASMTGMTAAEKFKAQDKNSDGLVRVYSINAWRCVFRFAVCCRWHARRCTVTIFFFLPRERRATPSSTIPAADESHHCS